MATTCLRRARRGLGTEPLAQRPKVSGELHISSACFCGVVGRRFETYSPRSAAAAGEVAACEHAEHESDDRELSFHAPTRLMSADSRMKRSVRPCVTRNMALPRISDVVNSPGKTRIRTGTIANSGLSTTMPS